MDPNGGTCGNITVANPTFTCSYYLGVGNVTSYAPFIECLVRIGSMIPPAATASLPYVLKTDLCTATELDDELFERWAYQQGGRYISEVRSPFTWNTRTGGEMELHVDIAHLPMMPAGPLSKSFS